MSYRTITIDQLMQLNPAQLKTTLRLFNQELDGTIAFLHETAEARRDADLLQELSNLLTLRKVFELRLEELGDIVAQPLSAEALLAGLRFANS